MAKRKTDLESEIDILTEHWVSVSKKDNPLEYGAWLGWRKREMGSLIEPDNFTVPTALPPTTVAGAAAYFDAVRKFRKANNWNNSRSILPKDPSAWMGEI